MRIIKKSLFVLLALLLLLVAVFDIWGRITLGSLEPQENALRDDAANRVVLVSGATGSVGDGLLKAANRGIIPQAFLR